MEQIVLREGKYTVILNDNPHEFYAMRHGETWIAGKHLDNLHLAMFQRIRYLESLVYRGGVEGGKEK